MILRRVYKQARTAHLDTRVDTSVQHARSPALRLYDYAVQIAMFKDKYFFQLVENPRSCAATT